METKANIKKQILAFVKKNEKIPDDFIDFEIHWDKRVNGVLRRVCYSVSEQKVNENPETNKWRHYPTKICCRRTSTNGYFPAVIVRGNENIIEFSIVFIDLHRVKQGEERHWDYEIPNSYNLGNFHHYSFPKTRVFVYKGDKNLYDQYGDEIERGVYGTICKYIPKFARFSGFTKVVSVAKQTYNLDYDETDPDSYWRRYNVAMKSIKENGKTLPKKRSKEAVVFEEIIKTPLNDKKIDDVICQNNIPLVRYATHIYICDNGVTESGYEFSVIREYGVQYDNSLYECRRLYAYKKTVRCALICLGKFQSWDSAKSYYQRHTTVHIFFENEIKNQLLANAINKGGKENIDIGFYAKYIKDKLFEKFFNAGLFNFLRLFPKFSSNTNKALERMFEVKPGDTLKTATPLNMNQLRVINAYYENKYPSIPYGFMRTLKAILGDDIKSASTEDFTLAMKFVDKSHMITDLSTMRVDVKTTLRRIKNIADKYGDVVYGVFSDGLSLQMQVRNPMILNLDRHTTYQDIVRWHNANNETLRAQIDEREAIRAKGVDEAIKKIKTKYKSLEYQDDVAIITLPSTGEEIRREGSELHHCVGGYVDRHACGQTMIFFLRDIKFPDSPLGTIELRGNTIIQIHLKYNAWLGTRPEYIPSVMKWIRQNGIYCEDKILLSTATGYSDNNAALVQKPVIA